MAKKRKTPDWVKEKADAAERRAKGLPLDEARAPIDPPRGPEPRKPATAYPIKSPGRPPKYKAKFAAIAKAMCKFGATDADLADEFGVTTATIWRWQCKHKAFCSALKVGKATFDDQIERALALRARGFSYDAVKVMQDKGVPVFAPYREYVPPDVGAIKLWLTNRRPEQWREKVDIDHSGVVQIDQIRRVIVRAPADHKP